MAVSKYTRVGIAKKGVGARRVRPLWIRHWVRLCQAFKIIWLCGNWRIPTHKNTGYRLLSSHWRNASHLLL